MEAEAKSTWRAFPPEAAREDCSVCRGTGWHTTGVPGCLTARRCPCTRLNRLLELRERIRIPERYSHCRLERFKPVTSSQARALSEACKFVACYPAVPRDLFLAGGPGVGKTHLAVGIAQALLRRFIGDVLFLDFGDFLCSNLDDSRSSFLHPFVLSRARQAALLLIDNFGMVAPSSRRVGLTEELILTRLRTGRRTIYTGEAFRCRNLFAPAARAGRPASTEGFLRALSPQVLMQFLGGLKTLAISGSDHRRGNASSHLLFG